MRAPPSRALEQRRVVITRPRAQADAFAREVADRGGIPVLLPTIEIRPVGDPAALDEALMLAARYDWIVCTSANAVAAVWQRLDALGRTLAGVRLAAVGPATAAALRARGAEVLAVPADFHGAAIAGTLGELAGARVLLPRSDLGREETAALLRARGAVVDEVTAYHTTPAVADPAGLAAVREQVDAVTFASPSAVRNFDALVPDARECLSRTLVACIGPTTAGAVVALGLPAPLLAASATGIALLDAIEAHFAAPARS